MLYIVQAYIMYIIRLQPLSKVFMHVYFVFSSFNASHMSIYYCGLVKILVKIKRSNSLIVHNHRRYMK